MNQVHILRKRTADYAEVGKPAIRLDLWDISSEFGSADVFILRAFQSLFTVKPSFDTQATRKKCVSSVPCKCNKTKLLPVNYISAISFPVVSALNKSGEQIAYKLYSLKWL